jgi:hypothetical protein
VNISPCKGKSWINLNYGTINAKKKNPPVNEKLKINIPVCYEYHCVKTTLRKTKPKDFINQLWH